MLLLSLALDSSTSSFYLKQQSKREEQDIRSRNQVELARGEMISDLPAMHDTAYNERSFSLRAKPSSSHIPSSSSSSSSTSLFCHSCLANQTLIMNMLANYLPDDDDPSYPMLYADLPNYLAKLHSRYPPVCRNCQPAVDEALRKSDHRAQVQAWSSALDRGARSPSRGDGSGGGEVGRVSKGDTIIWRIRGILWWISLGLSMGQGILNVSPPTLPRIPMSLFLFNALSIIWIAWDPYWLRRVRNREKVKVEGRGTWISNMLLITLARLMGSMSSCLVTSDQELSYYPLKLLQATFAIEIALLLHSLMSIKISQPIAIKLVRPVSVTSDIPPASQSISNANGISSLSLSSHTPTQTKNGVNPIFGQPSLHQPLPEPQADAEPMDWEPTQQPSRYPMFSPQSEDGDGDLFQTKQDWDKFGTNKQRMFHNKNDETGLESLLAGWGLGGTTPNTLNPTNANRIPIKSSLRKKPSHQWEIIDIIGAISLMVRFSGVINIIVPTILDLYLDIGIFKSLHRWVLVIESFYTATKCLLYLHRRNYDIANTTMIKILWSAVNLALRCSSLVPSVGPTSWLGLLVADERWRIAVEWSIWGLMDGVTLFI
uniref:Ima1 N-terminal domain-containing protein n=1 Tax=Kwoniella bestiolae CBS 10118 TaxID=1296100 RepID=A0A1B9GGB4_9TREE|nr:hypothetical protein I302_01598 [Kwoniella bestiolae CBS 10118]OCF30079.1 hypothetical protein I302_01598 [Kwoniella bestiolae CBS 10118]